MYRGRRWRVRFARFPIVIALLLLVTLFAGSGGGAGSSASAGEAKSITLAVLHFSVIKGTTWSGAHHRAAQRIAKKYPNVKYVYREEVGPDLTIPYAEELIRQGANIVVGNAEFMGLPLKEIADKYPNVYFASVVASDVTTKRNFIRFFPRQYQALYLEGLIAAALTRSGNVGVVSAFPNIQVLRRTAGFYLGVQDGAKALNKRVNVYVKYVGDWYKPAEEREIVTYTRQLLRTNRVDQAVFDALGSRHGVPWLVELTAVLSYFAMIAAIANAFEVAAPPDGDRLPG